MARNNKSKKRSSGDAPDKQEREYRSKNETSTTDSSKTKDAAGSEHTTVQNEKSPNSDDKVANKGPMARSGNDPEWYSKDNQLVIDAASIPFSVPLGDPLKLSESGQRFYEWGTNDKVEQDSSKPMNDAPAGILTLTTKSSFGSSDNIRSPLNVAANMLYTHVRYMNSGRKNYDPADLMMYVGSMGDVYSYLVWLERIYAKAFIYSQRNKYIGEMLLASEGVNPTDIKLNLANMRYWINTFINKVSSYAIPAGIPYFNRRVWIYSSIYLENPDGNIRDQLYQFVPDGFYRFELDSNSAGSLKYYIMSEMVTPSAGGYTFSELTQIGEFLMANITGDEDFGLMSGDIIKAFNGDIIGLPGLPEVVDIVPVYSEYVLEQIHNATIIESVRGASTTDRCGDVWQDPATGIIYEHECVECGSGSYQNYWERSNIAIRMKKVLTVNTPVPNPIDVMEATRLTIGYSGYYHGATLYYTDLSVGADYATGATITTVLSDGTINRVTYHYNALPYSFALSNKASLKGVFRHWVFKYAPLIYMYDRSTAEGTSGTISDITVLGNINNFTVVDDVPVNKMHEVALLSLLSVPGVAKIVNI